MLKVYNALVNIGVHEGIDSKKRIKVRLSNQLFIITLLVLFILTAYRLATVGGSVLPQMRILVIILVGFTLNYKRKYFYAWLIPCFLVPTSIGLVILQEGARYGEFVMFIACSLFAFIFFEGYRIVALLAILWNVSIGVYCLYFIDTTFDVNPIQSDLTGSILIFIVNLFVLGMIIYFYQQGLTNLQATQLKLLEELKEKNEALERFTFAASHDMKEPLSNILAFSDLLGTDKVVEGNNYEEQYLDVIKKNAKIMKDIIRNSLEFISIGKKELEIKEIDLNKLVEEVNPILSSLLRTKNGIIEIQNNLPTIRANKTDVLSVMKNLIENGIKYNHSKNPIVKITSQSKEDEYIISISDNGPGISEEDQKLIFNMFKRLEGRVRNEGSGLGLAICKKIVNSFGGRIWIDSKPGKGSTFSFSVPK